MLNEFIQSSIQEAWDTRAIKGLWDGSPFEDLIKISSDERGRWGEQLLHTMILNAGMNSQWNGDSNTNSDDGTYDLVVDNKHRVEIKTAIYSGGKWQHDGLRTNGCWDYLICIDLSFDHIIISVVSYEDFAASANSRQKHNVFNITPHLRKSTTDIWKFDFGNAKTIENQHQRGIASGCTFDYDINEPDEEGLYNFLTTVFK